MGGGDADGDDGGCGVNVADLIEPDLLAAEIAGGWIAERRRDGLRVLNYSKRTGYARRWNAATILCRGLVLDDAGDVVCRPFPKFFNLDEHAAMGLPLPDRPPDEVTEKLDGALLIVGNHEGRAFATTRGDPNGPIAAVGRAMLDGYGFAPAVGRTYCFEVIHPATKVVVEYGGQGLVLLACLDNATGLPVADDAWWGPVAGRAPWPLDGRSGRESEGAVLYWRPGVWAKAKRADYVRMHRLLTGTTPRRVWEALRDGTLADLRADAPEEFRGVDRRDGGRPRGQARRGRRGGEGGVPGASLGRPAGLRPRRRRAAGPPPAVRAARRQGDRRDGVGGREAGGRRGVPGRGGCGVSATTAGERLAMALYEHGLRIESRHGSPAEAAAAFDRLALALFPPDPGLDGGGGDPPYVNADAGLTEAELAEKYRLRPMPPAADGGLRARLALHEEETADRLDALAAEVAALRRDRDADLAAFAEVGERLSRCESAVVEVVANVGQITGRVGEMGYVRKELSQHEHRLAALEVRALDGGDPLRRVG